MRKSVSVPLFPYMYHKSSPLDLGIHLFWSKRNWNRIFLKIVCLVGYSIPLNEPKECVQNVENSMGYCHRINQLYSTVCPHENQLRHAIANHYKDTRNWAVLRKIRTLAAQIIQRIKKKPTTSTKTTTTVATNNIVCYCHRSPQPMHLKRWNIKEKNPIVNFQ